MNPSIQGLLATVDQTCMIAKNRIANFKLTPEQAKEVVAGFAASKSDKDVLAGPAFSLSAMILGDHKRLMQRNTYDALDTLRSLTFEEYIEFQGFCDQKSIVFYSEVSPLITKLYEEQILPLLIKNSLDGFLNNLYDDDDDKDLFGKDPDE